MKGLNKLALAAAISAAPFAQAMETIDDAMLGEMTGQSGITIELSTHVSIGDVTYTDTDGLGNGAGTVVMDTIEFGGAAAGSNFDEVKIDIDVDAEAGLVIHLGGTDLQGILEGTNPVDFGLRVGSVSVGTNNADGGVALASGIDIQGNLGPVDIVISDRATDPGTGTRVDVADFINVSAYFEVTDGSLTVDALGLGITGMTIGKDSNPFSISSNATYAALSGMGTGDDNWAHVAMTIGTAATSYNTPDGAGGYVTVPVTAALSVNISSMSMDINIADMTIGASAGALSLGGLAINDLDLSGTSLTIYGH